ncbi:hypothetical protein LCGC14_0603750 [marine sediment metagenome]|uniref:Uncharacterized protein n=1 Tax=marine sediment metagenome TaxID=412755 RepID=A0A0F9UIB2_9ZZZZ|nr:hypothetical protein [bacterium]
MSEAHYIFLPYVRQGMAQFIETPDNIATTGHRTSLQIDFNIEGRVPSFSKDIELYGPGDITGINQRMIVRTDPTYRAIVGDYEPNFMPLIEFSRLDFPWCMTPVRPVSSDHLRPWLCLIVLEAPNDDSEGEYSTDTVSDGLLLGITVNDALLPDLSQSWSWAHVQVTTETDEITNDELQRIIQQEPHRVISRIVCYRRLRANVKYTAFLVPTFKTGVFTGLGRTYNEAIDGPMNLVTPAWGPDSNRTGDIYLPYYFKWDFHTGSRGDFEYLVRMLEPRVIDKHVGIRHIDCQRPGYNWQSNLMVSGLNIDDPLKYSLGLEGALRSLQTESTIWPDSTTDPWSIELQALLNLAKMQHDSGTEDPNDSPVIVPPLYGQWHGNRNEAVAELPDSVDPEGRDWFNKLNLDPRYRTTSGFGTMVIQDQQEQLMESAWAQVDTILEANWLLNQAQLGMRVTSQIFGRHFLPLPEPSLLSLTSNLHSRILIPIEVNGESRNFTLKHVITYYSRLSPGIFSPTFTRISRPRGPQSLSQNEDSDPDRKNVIERINDGEIRPAGDHPTPSGIISSSSISDDLRPPLAGLVEFLGSRAPGILSFFIIILAILIFAAFILHYILVNMGISGLGLQGTIITYIVISIVILILLLRFLLRLYYWTIISQRFRSSSVTADILSQIQISPEFQFYFPPGIDVPDENPFDEFSPQRFLDFAITAHGAFLDRGLEEIRDPGPLNFDEIQQSILYALNPKKTIVDRTRSLFQFSYMVNEDLRPIRVAPVFPQPMYEALRDLSNELLLPGLEFIPPNTIGFVETNQKFIESYIVGLNTEMAREFRWREYPARLDGTYFRQFWDVSEYYPPQNVRTEIANYIDNRIARNIIASDDRDVEIEKEIEERLKDIDYIHRWRNQYLGFNPTPNSLMFAVDPDTGEEIRKLVLLIRGDLLKKYPTAVIYAVRGEWVEVTEENDIYISASDDGKKWNRQPDFEYKVEEPKYPVFKGTLLPDITFLGFDLVEHIARGSTVYPEDSGWYFVIEERIGETRFGIDESLPDNVPDLKSWEDLCWQHIEGSLTAGYVNWDTVPPFAYDWEPSSDQTKWNSHSGNSAFILLQKPVRIGIHSDDMMPKEE